MKRICTLFIPLIVLSFWLNITSAQAQDTTRPTVSIDAPSDVQNGPFEVTITFSEPVINFLQSEVLVSGGAGASSITAWTPQTGGREYTFTITPRDDITSSVNIQVPADVAEDAANNGNVASSTREVLIDT